MWVFLNNAFLSIVQDKNDPDRLMVRARLRGDLERVFPYRANEVSETPIADYRFRMSVERDEVQLMVDRAVRDITYTNFKKSVPETSRHNTYLRVWNEMWRAQQEQFPHAMVYRRFDQGELYDAPVRDPDEALGIDNTTGALRISEVIKRHAPKKKPVNRRGKKAARPRSSRR